MKVAGVPFHPDPFDLRKDDLRDPRMADRQNTDHLIVHSKDSQDTTIMKLSLLLAAGLVGFAAPAFAQNFTIPAGDTGFAAAPPQYDRAADLIAIAPAAVYHGRSVAISHSHRLKAAPRGE